MVVIHESLWLIAAAVFGLACFIPLTQRASLTSGPQELSLDDTVAEELAVLFAQGETDKAGLQRLPVELIESVPCQVTVVGSTRICVPDFRGHIQPLSHGNSARVLRPSKALLSSPWWRAMLSWTPERIAAASSSGTIPMTCFFVSPKEPSSSDAAAQKVDLISTVSAPFHVPDNLALPDLVSDTSVAAVEQSCNWKSFWRSALNNHTAATRKYVFLKTKMHFVPLGLLREMSQNPSAASDMRSRVRARYDHDLWLSSPGISTHMHYDLQHNFYTQQHGHKRFVLASPDCLESFYLYPSTHPRSRSIQLPRAVWEDRAGIGCGAITGPCTGQTDKVRFPLLSRLPPACRVHAGVLAPGDTLYIPPFWLHSGLATTESMSHSTCHESEEERIIATLEQAALPFEQDWGLPQRTYALRYFFAALLVDGNDTVDTHACLGLSRALWDLTQQRYASLTAVPLECRVDTAERLRQYGGTCQDFVDSSLLPSDLKDRISSAASRIRPTIRRLQGVSTQTSSAVARLVVHNYIEEVSSFLLGPSASVKFLYCCSLSGGQSDGQDSFT